MSKTKDPAFLFYPADASEDTQFMNRLERGAYFDIVKSQRLFHGITMEQMRKILGKDFSEVWPALELVLNFDETGYFIPWVRESLRARKEFHKKQKERIEKRWNNHGNTTVLPKIENENGIINKEIGVQGEEKMKVRRFIPPQHDEVKEYFHSLGNMNGAADMFFDYFTSNGWKVGKAKASMKDWKAAARNWLRNEYSVKHSTPQNHGRNTRNERIAAPGQTL